MMLVIDIGPHFFYTSLYQNHKEINLSRVRDTCKWFLDHPIFKQWKCSSHDELLWLSAKPGCGKSVLSKALIDDRLVDDRSAMYSFSVKDEHAIYKSKLTVAMQRHMR